jgi:hypothetical protein
LPRVEYQGTYTGGWTSRDGVNYSVGGHVWLGASGAVISLEKSGITLVPGTPIATADVPPTLPEGSNLDSPQVLFLRLPFTFNVCDFVGSVQTTSIPDALGSGHTLEWLARWTEAPPP